MWYMFDKKYLGVNKNYLIKFYSYRKKLNVKIFIYGIIWFF